MHHGYPTLKQKCFLLSLKLPVASVLSQRRRQSVPHAWSSDTETFVAKAGVCLRHRTCPIMCTICIESLLFLGARVQPTLDPCAEAFCGRPIALTQEERSLVDDVCECVHD